MTNPLKECIYDKNSEKELIKMWEDIKGNNTASLNRTLMKTISEIEEKEPETSEIPLYTKQMWDSELGKWVTFELWGAHFIVNSRKESLLLRMYRPVMVQSEFGPTLYGWQTMDSSYLNEKLKEKDNPYENYEKNCESFAGMQEFNAIIKQDCQEYVSEQRYEEYQDKFKFSGAK